jgi:predicted Ser/Thr protein kinase
VPSVRLREAFPGYEVVRELHRGGQGVVYLGIQTGTRRKVAIKVLHEGPFVGAAGRARFDREVQVLGQLDHANIVKIHESGATDAGALFYVMDYVPGRALDDYAAHQSRFDIRELLGLFARICEAVGAAHLLGIIHRDLKPANIRVKPDGEPVVVDFGLAKASAPGCERGGEHPAMTVSGQFVGSLPWASPEQAEGAPGGVDVRTDVYSLGVVLYQLLTGRFPYDVTGGMREVLEKIAGVEPARPRSLRPEIDDEVETIVLKCLQKARERRYQTAGELARDVRHYLAGEPIEAKRDSATYMLRKLAYRYRAAVAVGALILVLVVAFGVTMSVQYRRSTVAEARAQRGFGAARELARTFMFDFHDMIEDLPGATPARELLLVEAQGYLEDLSREAAGDPELRLELAEAYDRVGDLQAKTEEASLGRSEEAAKNYEEARKIRESLRGQLAGDHRLLAGLAASAHRLGTVLRKGLKYGEAREKFEQAVAGYDGAIAAAGAERDTVRRYEVERIGSRLAIGGMDRLAAEASATPGELLESAQRIYEEVASFWEARLAADASSMDAAQGLGVVRDKLADLDIERGRVQFRAAQAAEGKEQQGAALREAARLFSLAAEAASRTAAEFERLAREHPENTQLSRDQYVALHNAGYALQWTGDAVHELALLEGEGAAGAAARAREPRERSLAEFARALAITETLARSDPASVSRERDVCMCLNKMANAQRKLDLLDAAVASAQRSLELRLLVYDTDPTARHRRDLILGLYKRAELHRLVADRGGEGVLGEYRSGARLLRQALGHIEAMERGGSLPPEGAELKAVAAELARCETAIERLLGTGPP